MAARRNINMMTGRGKIKELTCGECGKTYTSRKPTDFCSRRCAATARHKALGHGTRAACPECGKPVPFAESKFCSRACYIARKLKHPVKFTCKVCGKEVDRHWRKNSPRAKYCSHACRAESRRKGGSISQQGYRVLHINKKPVLEHRHVMEKIIGRPLLPTESVHHRDGDRLNNDPPNLELWDKSQPAGQRVEEKIAWAVGFLGRHGFVFTDLTVQSPARRSG